MDQKRKHERFETDIPVKLTIAGKGKARFEAFARVRDVSLGGAFIASGFRFKKEGEQLDVELGLPSGPLAIKARVVRQPDGGLGIQFVDVSRAQREHLLKHFVPAEHQRFYDEVAQALLPRVDVDRVSLLLHLWEEWRADASTRPAARKPPPRAQAAPPKRR